MMPLFPKMARSLAFTLIALGVLNGQTPAPVKPATPANDEDTVAPRKKRVPRPRPKKPAAPKVKLVDINHAGVNELKTLPGVNEELAQRIIANRPYLSKAFLVTKKVMPIGTYQGLSKQVVAVQKVVKAK